MTQNLFPDEICVHVPVPDASWWTYVWNKGWCLITQTREAFMSNGISLKRERDLSAAI